MRRVSVRDLSAEAIRNSADDDEVLGVTSKGVLVGVLVPLTNEILQRLAAHDLEELVARSAEADLDAGASATNLRDVLHEAPARPPTAPAFDRVGIRELNSGRLEQAATDGRPLVVTSDRVDLAAFIPLVQGWVDRLVEQSVSKFLSGSSPEVRTGALRPGADSTARTELIRGSYARFSSQRAIGIRIVGDARHDRERIVGVITDGLAQLKSEPVMLPLEQLDETYVFDRILSLINTLSSQLDDTHDLIGVGVEIGGHVAQGRVVRSTNIRWNQFPLAEQLSAAVNHIPVVLENDANALAIHERFSQGISAENFAVVLLTHLGVGCGLILDGRLHRGSRGMAAELGHIPSDSPVAPDHRCRCGNARCLEAVATPQAIEVALRAAGFIGQFEDAFDKAQDQSVRDIFARAGGALGEGIATVLNLLNPQAVVLYGPLNLVGPPRQFHIDNFDKIANAQDFQGLGRHYQSSMLSAISSSVFSNAAEECQFIIRVRTDEQGAKAAAACVIHAIRSRAVAASQHGLPNYAEQLQ